MRTLLCVCPPRVESLFPPVLSKSCNQILLAFKVWFSRNSSSHCWPPRLGSLTWGSEPSLQWVDFCGRSVLQFVSHPPSSYGIWFYCDCAPPTISLRLLLCLWGIFLVSSSVFLSMIVQQLVVIPVLLQEGVSARPSTPPYWTNLQVQEKFWTWNHVWLHRSHNHEAGSADGFFTLPRKWLFGAGIDSYAPLSLHMLNLITQAHWTYHSLGILKKPSDSLYTIWKWITFEN